MRCEKRQGLISPVIAEARRSVLLVERKDRKKLDCTDAKILQIGNLFDQPGVGAILGRRDTRTWMPRKPADGV